MVAETVELQESYQLLPPVVEAHLQRVFAASVILSIGEVVPIPSQTQSLPQ